MPITGAYGGIIGVDNTPSPSKQITEIDSSGCFNRTTATATVVVVAGGGGGSLGGGGAGGVLVTTCHPLPTCAVPVTIGAGGARTDAQAPVGNHGNNTVFGSATPLTALKGMGGGGGNSDPVADDPQNPAGTSAFDGGIYGSGGGAGGANPAMGGKGTHPGAYGGCSPTFQGCPGGSGDNGGGGGADNTGYGQGFHGGGQQAMGGQGRDLTPLGVPSCVADCGFVGGGGAGKCQAHPSNPHSLALPLTNFASRQGKKMKGGGGRGQTGVPTVACVCSTPLGSTAGDANTGGGGGGGGYPGSAPFPSGVAGEAGGSGKVIVIECVAGSSANDGIYSLKEHYVAVKSSRW